MAFKLPPLPYPGDDPMSHLEPHISKKTLEFHYGKHHQAYVNKLNELIEGTEYSGKTLEEVIQDSFEDEYEEDSRDVLIFNNAAQVWNHTFYWHCMKKDGGGDPHGEILRLINRDFGSYENFKTLFKAAAVSQFGSGWAWVVCDQDDDNKLHIIKSGNAKTPVAENILPVLTCDVWEHAYYIDYRNRRPDFVAAFWNVVNWDFAEQNYKG